MSKRKNPVAITPRKKAALRPTFKSFGLKELIETETVDSKKHIPVELGSIFTYSDREGVICKISLRFCSGQVLGSIEDGLHEKAHNVQGTFGFNCEIEKAEVSKQYK